MAADDLSPSMLPPGEDGGEQLTDAELRALIEKARSEVDEGRTIPLDDFEREMLAAGGPVPVEDEPLARAELPGGWVIEKLPVPSEREAAQLAELDETQYWTQAEMGSSPRPTLAAGCMFCGSPIITVGAMGRSGAAGVGMCESCAREVETKLGLTLDRMEPQEG